MYILEERVGEGKGGKDESGELGKGRIVGEGLGKGGGHNASERRGISGDAGWEHGGKSP